MLTKAKFSKIESLVKQIQDLCAPESLPEVPPALSELSKDELIERVQSLESQVSKLLDELDAAETSLVDYKDREADILDALGVELVDDDDDDDDK